MVTFFLSNKYIRKITFKKTFNSLSNVFLAKSIDRMQLYIGKSTSTNSILSNIYYKEKLHFII